MISYWKVLMGMWCGTTNVVAWITWLHYNCTSRGLYIYDMHTEVLFEVCIVCFCRWSGGSQNWLFFVEVVNAWYLGETIINIYVILFFIIKWIYLLTDKFIYSRYELNLEHWSLLLSHSITDLDLIIISGKKPIISSPVLI